MIPMKKKEYGCGLKDKIKGKKSISRSLWVISENKTGVEN